MLARSTLSSGLPPTMLAAVVHAFGAVDAIALEEIPVPVPGPGQVLVRVEAAGVGPWDGWVRAGKSVLPQPLPLTPGAEISGIVAAAPQDAPFKVGDVVFGVTNARFTNGSAQYALAATSMLARKPATLSHIEAASIPVVAVTAWAMAFDHAHLREGQSAFVHGGAGNVGAYAVQLARSRGVKVMASALPHDTERVRALGAEVVELNAPAIKILAQSFDAVLDTVGSGHEALFSLLKPGGILVSSVRQPDPDLARRHGASGVFFVVEVTTERLEDLARLFNAGDLSAAVGDVVPLARVREAHEMLEGLRPHHAGKIVLTMTGPD